MHNTFEKLQSSWDNLQPHLKGAAATQCPQIITIQDEAPVMQDFPIFLSFFPFYSCTHGLWKPSSSGSNQNCSCQRTPQPQQRQIHAVSATYATAGANAGSVTHWVRPGIEPASSQRLRWVINLLSHNGNFRSSNFSIQVRNSDFYEKSSNLKILKTMQNLNQTPCRPTNKTSVVCKSFVGY